jgi:hypothetical protein
VIANLAAIKHSMAKPIDPTIDRDCRAGAESLVVDLCASGAGQVRAGAQ